MNNRIDVINYLILTYGLTSYLEIGVQHPANCFDKIKAKNKFGVDPDPKELPAHPFSLSIYRGTSDEYFNCPCGRDHRYDIVFIDGLHHAEQVKKDFENALARLNPGGFIVLHDANPTNKTWTLRPRVSRVWTGDVYKFICSLHDADDIEYYTLDFDYGVTVAQPVDYRRVKLVDMKYGWNDLVSRRKELLNLMTADEFIKIFNEEDAKR